MQEGKSQRTTDRGQVEEEEETEDEREEEGKESANEEVTFGRSSNFL